MEPLQQRFVECAVKRFLAYGVRSVTMDQIAQDAGASKRTVYELFADKEELVKACIQYFEESRSSESAAIIAESENVLVALFKIANHHLQVFQYINPLFFQDIERFYPTLWKDCIYRNSIEKQKEIKKFLEIGIEQGFIRPDIHLAIAVRVLLEHTNLALAPDIIRHSEDNRRIIFENLIINYVRGISTDAGLKLLQELNQQSFLKPLNN